MDVRIRTAVADEAETLSDLALRSKSHWGYSADFLDACRAELTYDAETCASGDVFVAAREDRILGFAAIAGTPPEGELEALFVDIGAMGQGIGRDLLHHVLMIGRARGFRSFTLDADPGAEPFYLHHGAVRIGESQSGSIPGRVLPALRFDLA